MAKVAKALAVLALGFGLASCDAIKTLWTSSTEARATADALEKSLGVKPQVGFNWTNGKLVTVTAAFPRPFADKSMDEVAEKTRSAVTANFHQTPAHIMLQFEIGPGS